mmetsp:Transcript_13936/g.16806  ORF Transcript_13936/g.16806 Transcript_13936/m.16806 type:complete len:264 (+) Transcript_13936:93-884(+)|eukprot:CAMPEP_0197851220 /NCGR_PEP_ID=MMETSP1438-20131217/17563_1 /TAXON_ID=1461541 /ORGANISM="Pterosperma sp., Strain CCMP1384" /LENGTH=263 /DNA_ID=CAMNT_0043464747 /DNA_START=82 /DNA_END=873 /DNA_ORIENTATION=+
MSSPVEVQKKGNYAIISMCKEPVNSMDCKFWTILGETLKALENDPTVKGVIFASGLKKDIFTAGNDINELYAPGTNFERFDRFWRAKSNFLINLYRSPLATVAAIRGYCPAGGCILAMCCDYRIQTDDPKARIGLNEVALGISVPRFWDSVMINLVGFRKTELLLQTAALPTSKEAKEMGLIDQLVSKEDLMPAAEKVLSGFLKFPREGANHVKMNMRGALANEWETALTEDIALTWKTMSDPRSVAALGAVLKKLSGGKAKL